jgi:hypothetical protein
MTDAICGTSVMYWKAKGPPQNPSLTGDKLSNSAKKDNAAAAAAVPPVSLPRTLIETSGLMLAVERTSPTVYPYPHSPILYAPSKKGVALCL